MNKKGEKLTIEDIPIFTKVLAEILEEISYNKGETNEIA